MQINHPSTGVDYHATVGNHRTGNRISRVLLSGEEGRPDNYRFSCSAENEVRNDWTDWTTPRHHHPYEQIRYMLEGKYSIGKDEDMPEGWVAYFPESAYYGPQTKYPNMTMLVLQFGGPSGIGYHSMRQRKQAYQDLLAKGGKFEDGIYTWTDEQGERHNMDSAEAIWGQEHGRPLVYPEARYDSVILMNPENFQWTKDERSPGVERKTLGSFTERDVRIGFVRIEKGASATLGNESSNEVMFLKDGSITHEGETYGPRTAFGTDASEKPETLTAAKDSELFYIKLPTF